MKVCVRFVVAFDQRVGGMDSCDDSDVVRSATAAGAGLKPHERYLVAVTPTEGCDNTTSNNGVEINRRRLGAGKPIIWHTVPQKNI